MSGKDPTATKEARTAWEALDGAWFYLGRPLEGVMDVALLTGTEGPVAPAFTTERAAGPFLQAAPAGIELLAIAEDDPRAKEEWLRAVLERGARIIVFDPHPRDLSSALRTGASGALDYVMSYRRETACL